MPIKKILIANRGEIACRIMRTCRELGIASVAVYSEADADALHVALADESRLIGPAAAAESYLDMGKVLAAAKETGADAVHPGYGFLSENADFAEACEKAGIIFIGPPAAAMRAMGGKSEAKALMETAKVPLVPGYHGDQQDEKLLKAEAEKMGYPVLIKASAGGGGKGMRIVERADDFSEQLSGAKREAKASFGNDHVLVEKYLTNPRHIEIQVFADNAGNTVHLFERDCSIQRRHQKVLEEAPAPGLSAETREKMGAAAVAAAKAIGYVGAGTVEFLFDEDGSFYFMEMNTRLQVEHPVTEYITGLDLVELQIRVAEGQALPFQQEDLKINGHAIEVRLYAEDPDNGFLPGAGKIQYLQFPMEGQDLRIDTGLREAPEGDGDVISIHYDPMIAKVIVHGVDRADAIAQLRYALDELMIAGPKTNLTFLRRLAAHKAFADGDVSTKFIEQHGKALLPEKTGPDGTALVLATLALVASRYQDTETQDPWHDLSSWRIGGQETESFAYEGGGVVHLRACDAAWTFDLEVSGDIAAAGQKYTASLEPSIFDLSVNIRLAGKVYQVVLLRAGRHLTLLHMGHQDELVYLDPLSFEADAEDAAGKLTAPMPGKVVAVRVQLGDSVKKGQPLIIVEAMKMEHTITAPMDGVIDGIKANVGDQVDEKLELIAFK